MGSFLSYTFFKSFYCKYCKCFFQYSWFKYYIILPTAEFLLISAETACCNRKKIAKCLMRTITRRSTFLYVVGCHFFQCFSLAKNVWTKSSSKWWSFPLAHTANPEINIIVKNRNQCPNLKTHFSRKQAQNAHFQSLKTSVFRLVFAKTGSINTGTGLCGGRRAL